MEDIIDEENKGTKETPQAVKTLGILSIVGSSLWGLLLLIVMFWLLGAASSLGRFLPIADPSGAMAAVVIIFLILIALNVFGIVGANKMMKGNKKGFILYAIVTGLWALLMLLGAFNNGNWVNWVSALSSIGFIVAFGMQMKELPEAA